MPLQNRVTPFGEIVAIPERGTLMGNRGILHDAGGQVRRRWAGRAWISCLLEFQGRRDPVMAPGHYTRLFFLDEPTAFAAGHRPCAYCRRADYVAFRDTWAAANAHLGLGSRPRATEIDRVLHAERLAEGGSKRLHPTELARLPDGVMVTDRAAAPGATSPPQPPSSANSGASPIPRSAPRAGSSDEMVGDAVFLIWGGRLWHWSPAGYRATDRPLSGEVLALTPPSIIATLAAGYPTMPPAGMPAPAPLLRAGNGAEAQE